MKNIITALKAACLFAVAVIILSCGAHANAASIYDKNPSTGMPYWYPDDVSTFENFLDYDAPRVVDVADIFTDEEEAEMLKIIEDIQYESGTDLVVFTDVSSYGLSRNVYAADFHHFNGYGFGDDFAGSILFICMEEGNRGWYTAATGWVEDIYKDMTLINNLDDKLEPYMVAGDYGEGVIDYLYNVYDLYKLPDWVYEIPDERYYNAKAPRIVDKLGVLTDAEKSELNAKINEIRNNYGTDVVVLIDDEHIYNYSMEDYAYLYYYYNGYGLSDDDMDGIMLYLRGSGTDFYLCDVFYGGERECYTYDNETNIENRIADKFYGGDVYGGISSFLKLTDKLYKKGKVSKPIDLKKCFLAAAIAALIGAGIYVGKLKSTMKTVATATYATGYLVPDSYKLTARRDHFLYKTVTKVKRESSSGSGGSSGGSFHSSGGRSYSGGGRSF